jgi:hypothetical protein
VTDSHLSPVREWPHWPNFDQFRRQAKELLKSYRAGDANAVAEVERHEMFCFSRNVTNRLLE